MDKIRIDSLKVPTVIGIHAFERQIKQTLSLDLSFGVDASQAHDDLSKTVDYDALCSFILEFGATSHFKLIETFAEQLSALCLEHFAIDDLTLSVKKPSAIKQANFVSITVHRQRNS